MAKLVSLKLAPKDAEKETVEAMEMEKPAYPYGTCLYLNDETLAALGIEKLEVGTKVVVQAEGIVTGYSERQYEGGEHKSLDVQLTDMAIAPPAKSAAETLYGGKAAE